MNDYIIAVDPGMTCGWAIAHFTEDRFSPEFITAGQSQADDWCDWVEENLRPTHLLIVEKFTITSRTATMSIQGSQMTLGVIGVMRHVARRRNAKFDLGQSPSDAKKFMPDPQLKKVGLWKPGQDHARDAIRHLMLGISQHGTGQAREEMLQSLA